MSTMLWLPAAKRDPHGRSLTFTEKTDPKGCLHTTETSGWPSYAGWTVHPHATVMPKKNVGVEIHQHVDFAHASFSLRNLSGGVETNRDYVFQFELIGTCTKGGPGYYWPDADDAVLKDLYIKLIKPLSDAYKIPLVIPGFQAYPASAGARKPAGPSNTVRLSGSAFDNFSGWVGHENVPENVHGDPGLFPWARMLALVRKPTPKPPSEDALSDIKDFEWTITTQNQADWINSNSAPKNWLKIGDKVGINRLLAWGGPGIERIFHTLSEEVKAAAEREKAAAEREKAAIERDKAAIERDKAILAAVQALSAKVDLLTPPPPPPAPSA